MTNIDEIEFETENMSDEELRKALMSYKASQFYDYYAAIIKEMEQRGIELWAADGVLKPGI